MSTTSSEFLSALAEAGVSFIFVNLGSDHPALVEAIAEFRALGRRIPEIITCPNEMVGLSAAHGYYQATGVAQAVIVHVECGTQALAGAVHNAAKGHIPVLIFAGASPFTQHGEMKGSRNEFIQWIQDIHDQRGIVRPYMNYDNEIRTGKNVKELVYRALQFAYSDPKGPVYLVGAREVMEEEVSPTPDTVADWRSVEPTALAGDVVADIGRALLVARRPLLVTSAVGRNPQAVTEVVALCRMLGIGVLESVPNAVNFPHDDPLYQGNQWNDPRQNAALAEADVILVVESDVPWIPAVSRPADSARIFQIDSDPLKRQMPLWHIAAERVCCADPATALAQIAGWLADQRIEFAVVEERSSHYAARHAERVEALARLETPPAKGVSAEYFLARLRRFADADCLFVNEGISYYPAIFNHLAPTRPGTVFTSGGGSLGWNGGAAIGVKLAYPGKTVIALTGDGSFMFSVPSSVHWMARRYKAPFLQIIFNNGGWKSPKLSTLAVHPQGYAARAEHIDTSFEPAADYIAIAKASGAAWGQRIYQAAEVDVALARAFGMVRGQGGSAVLEIMLDHH